MNDVLDFVALRKPVLCRLPDDREDSPPREIVQYRRLQFEMQERANAMRDAGDKDGATAIVLELVRYALPDITDEQIFRMGEQDWARLLGAAQGKSAMVEAALGNGRGDGDSSTKTENPSPNIPDSSTTTPAAPSSDG